MNAPDLFAGTPYRVRRLLGEGGMGEVYEVEHEIVGKPMVAKILRAEFADDVGLVDRMRVEAQALAALSHPNIVNVTDFSRTRSGRPFYVMEYLNGCTLGDEVRARGSLPVHEAVEITRQALRALGAAHRLGLVHRDIKLENIFLHTTPTGERVVKVLDFGVAKVLQGKDGANANGPAPPMLPTADGAVVGTPRYVSPEQVRGKEIDHRADIYAIGLVLYTIVCGRGPFDHLRRPEDLFIAHLSEQPKPPSKHVPGALPEDLDNAILRALNKDPNQRFQSASEFEAALGAIAEHWNAPIGWLATELSPPPTMQTSSLAQPTTPFALRQKAGNAASPHALSTHTAGPGRSAHQPPVNPLAKAGAGSSKATYAAAMFAAFLVSGVGVWLTRASSIVTLALIMLASIAAAGLTAVITTRLTQRQS